MLLFSRGEFVLLHTDVCRIKTCYYWVVVTNLLFINFSVFEYTYLTIYVCYYLLVVIYLLLLYGGDTIMLLLVGGDYTPL